MVLNPITWPDLDSWSRLTHNQLRDWEIEALFGIDAAYRNSVMSE